MAKVLKTRTLFTLFGVLLILGSLGMELLPNTQAGIGPLQLIGIIIGGGAIILSRIRGSLGLRLLISVLSLLFTVIVIEFVLALLGFVPKNAAVSMERVQIRPDWICDDRIGCRWDTAEAQKTCLENGEEWASTERLCHLNAQGYYDDDAFVSSAELTAADYKILVLGDSFTWGASADLGKSWVELLESKLNQTHDVVVWNTGIPAVGTKQALATAQHFIPVMQPDLVVLGFYVGNDFGDNLFPLDYGVRVSIDGSSVLEFVPAYKLDQNLKPIKLSPQEIAVQALGGYWAESEVERLLVSTRVGTLLLGALNRLPDETDRSNRELTETERLLEELNTYVTANNTQLLVLLIPTAKDLETPGAKYQAALAIMQKLGLTYVDPINIVVSEDHVNANPNDNHWNNEGHREVAKLLVDTLLPLVDGASASE